jgi:Gpi18-like mannosyltransferase
MKLLWNALMKTEECFARFLSKDPSRSFLWGATLAVFSSHFAIWWGIAQFKNISISQILSHWDSGWYIKIVEQGYDGQSWAFYPLWNWLLMFAQKLTNTVLPTALMGSLLACLLFFAFLHISWNFCRRYQREALGCLISPQSRTGFLFFLLFPASYVFHSNHTESLYILCTLLCCLGLLTRHGKSAAVFAGLAALTKNQGVLLAIFAGLWYASQGISWSQKGQRFLQFGLISGLIYSIFPFYQWLETGNPFMFMSVQAHWHPEISVLTVVKGLLIQNPWQKFSAGTIIHHLFFMGMLWASWRYMRHHVYLALYFLAFLSLEILAGELVGTLRYGTVLFPLIYFMGDRVAHYGAEYGVKARVFQYGALLGLLAINIAVTIQYGIARWAY